MRRFDVSHTFFGGFQIELKWFTWKIFPLVSSRNVSFFIFSGKKKKQISLFNFILTLDPVSRYTPAQLFG
jgi:hypothetical protein